jgi:predicted nuclease with TOPRIM domain
MALFSKENRDKVSNTPSVSPKSNFHSENIVNSRLTLLEDRYNTVRERLSFAEKSLVDNRDSLNKKIKVLDGEISDIHMAVNELKESILSLEEEIKSAAKESDVRVIDKYLELWEPLEFVTREEVNKALNKVNKPSIDEDVELHE